jgi:hypothetical protein
VDFRIQLRHLRRAAPPRVGRTAALNGAGARAPKYCAVGRIRYSEIDGPGAPDGILIYVKPAFYGAEPRDIFNYATANATFPHETTANQWFTESQFESYRMLGRHAIAQIAGAADGTHGLAAFCEQVRRYTADGVEAADLRLLIGAG